MVFKKQGLADQSPGLCSGSHTLLTSSAHWWVSNPCSKAPSLQEAPLYQALGRDSMHHISSTKRLCGGGRVCPPLTNEQTETLNGPTDSKARVDVQTQVCLFPGSVPALPTTPTCTLRLSFPFLGPWGRGCHGLAGIWFFFHVSSFPAGRGAKAKVLVSGMWWKGCVLLPLLPLTPQALQKQRNIQRLKAGISNLHLPPSCFRK